MKINHFQRTRTGEHLAKLPSPSPAIATSNLETSLPRGACVNMREVRTFGSTSSLNQELHSDELGFFTSLESAD